MRLVLPIIVLAFACKAKSDPPAGGSAAAASGSGSGSGSDDVVAGPSPRPPTGNTADPDYPTPAAAGTDQIFLLEEPDRGEKIPTTFDLKAKLAGVTLDRNAVVLSRHPERTYSWIGLELAEVLLVPLHVGDRQPFGTLWVTTETEDHFTRDDADVLSPLAECVGAAVTEWRRLQAAGALPV